MKLFLIGLPGSGKSTLAKDLSKKLAYSLIDIDEVVIKKEGMSIEEIFAKKGENYFRKIESDTLKELVKSKEDSIISTGGGTPCFFDNMDIINQHGLSVFLNIPVKDIALRLADSPDQNRPMLKGKNQTQIKKFLEEKLQERMSYYRLSKIQFTAATVTADQIIEEVLRQGLL